MHSVKEIVDKCHELAPAQLAESYDNVGLLVGDYKAPVKRILYALDLNQEVVEEAIEQGVDCIITHHPFLFKPLKRIDTGTYQGNILKQLLVNNIHLIAMHTNVDIAHGGINDFLAQKLQLTAIKPLSITSTRPMYKVSIYVPNTHLERVRERIVEWNPTKIGNYDGCTFGTEGIGTFKPLPGSNPTIGCVNQLEKVEETKLECMIDSKHLEALLHVVKEVHPYEEVAYDVYRLEHLNEVEGVGRWGTIAPTTLNDFVERIKEVFGIPYVRVTAKENKMIHKVAICSGSGSSFLKEASAVADVYITGDMTFHSAQEAMYNGLSVIDVGHYASENIALPLIKDYLQSHFQSLEMILSKVNGEVFEMR